MEYINQIPPMLRENYNPYLQAGRNPADTLHGWMSQYNESPYMAQRNERAMNAAQASAAAAGMAGTPSDQLNQANLSASLSDEGMNHFLDRIQRLHEGGLGATQAYTGDMGNVMGEQGDYAFKQQQQKNNDKNSFMNAIMQLIGMGGGAAIGAYAGGPAGAVKGAGIGSSVASGLTGAPQGQEMYRGSEGMPKSWARF
jgi:hypothetical protein